MARREFLQLAKVFEEGKHDPSGMYVSEKLDGTRVLWDGGITRGMRTEDVPWAGIMNPKEPGERKKKIKEFSTGLWTRLGNPVCAPDWWLNQLPAMFLDGELFAGRGNFQTLRSITGKHDASDDRWRDVKLAVFGAPCPTQVFAQGEIKNPGFVCDIDQMTIMKFVQRRADNGFLESFVHIPSQTFEQELQLLQASLPAESDVVYLHQHVLLPGDRSKAEAKIDTMMSNVLDVGGEGLMLRQPDSIWLPKRVKDLLKVKKFADDQGTVTGFVSGRKTNKGSKLLGLIGALILDYNGKRLELSGFTDEERRFATPFDTNIAALAPGKDMPSGTQGKHFKIGDTVEFRYMELSDDGIPKIARYLRQV